MLDNAFLQLCDCETTPNATPPDALARTALLCLKILDTAFNKEPLFLEQLRKVSVYMYNYMVIQLGKIFNKINIHDNYNTAQ